MCFLDVFKEACDSNKAERQIPVHHCPVSPSGLSNMGGPPPEEERSLQAWLPPWPSQAIWAGVCPTCLLAQAREGTCRSSGFDLKPGDPIALS